MSDKKKIYLEQIAKLLDEYTGDENDEVFHNVECSITFVEENDVAEVWDYTGGEFERLESRQ